MMKNIFEVECVYKTLSNKNNTVEVLRGVTFNIRDGETVGIRGYSGSGKSTLLCILGTLKRPTEGRVLFDGIDVFKHDDKNLSRIRNEKIGFIFQFPYLLPDLNALENVMVHCLVNGMENRTAEETSAAALERVGLANRLGHKPGELSGGEQQRVAIARSVVLGPKAVLADEPAGNLDIKTGMGIIDLLLGLNEEKGITLVIVQNFRTIDRLSKRITLSDGKIVDVN